MSNDSSNSTSPDPQWGIVGNSTCIDPSDPQAVWPYCPNLGAAGLFATIFAILSTVHIIEARIYRKTFCWVIIMGALWETAGFAFRIASIEYNISLSLYVAQLALILLAPLWINAYIYMVFARLVLFFTPDAKIWILKARRLSLIYVIADVILFFIQFIGVVMLSSTDQQTVEIGKNIYMAGLGAQVLFFTTFVSLVILFYRRMQAQGSERLQNWHHITRLLLASYVIFTVRTIYRLIEYSDGFTGPVPTHEVYYYLFDALLMATAIALWAIYHPGHVFQGPQSEFLSRKERKRLQKADDLKSKEEQHQTEHQLIQSNSQNLDIVN